MDDEQRQDEQQEPGAETQQQDAPDEDAGPAVEPAEGDQGEYVEQAPADAGPSGFDPDRPVRTSPPTAEQQSGVPSPTDGSNEGVEANEDMRGPVEPSQQGEPRGDETGAEPAPSGDES